MKILVAGGGSGKGIAVNNKTKATTYMKMAELQAGLGFGVKKFQVRLGVRDRRSAEQLHQLRLGVRRTGDGGGKVRRQRFRVPGAVSVSPGVWIYQVTDKGLALELTAKGTKYYKDTDLN